MPVLAPPRRPPHRLVGTAVVGVLVVGSCGDDAADPAAAPGTEVPSASSPSPAARPSVSPPPDSPAAPPSGPGTTSGDADADPAGDLYPDVLDVAASFDAASETWTFEVTMSSPYDSPERYADGWRVVGPDGTVYGVHTLAHDHAAEQPFTRRQTGVAIPADVTEVTVEGRDQISGFGGRTVTIVLQTGER